MTKNKGASKTKTSTRSTSSTERSSKSSRPKARPKSKKPAAGVAPITKDRAILALILNVIVLPGLGTIIAGDTNTGVVQLVLFLVGIPLSFVLIGIPLMIGMWIWALITGIQMVNRPE